MTYAVVAYALSILLWIAYLWTVAARTRRAPEQDGEPR